MGCAPLAMMPSMASYTALDSTRKDRYPGRVGCH